jgi:hypothetical protein
LVFPQAGWLLTGISGINIFRNGQNNCDPNKLHFFAGLAAQANVSARLSGAGCATIRFSNCWNTPSSFVGVWLDGTRIAQTVNTRSPSPEVVFTFSYTDGQVLAIKDEGANAVAEVYSLYFLDQCYLNGPFTGPNAVLGRTITSNDYTAMQTVRLEGSVWCEASESV